ncbi:MAG: DUF1385 domain-containing protein [Firmicutes bacterium]|nr:DUF1385 domain-containing protein [Bacillota bacterium]
MPKRFNYGGQAVIEGVMMRGPRKLAIAVRRPDGGITVMEEEIPALLSQWPFLRWPFFRGILALVEAMTLGIKALLLSANESLAEEEKIGQKEWALTVTGSIILALLVFFVLPTWLINLLKPQIGSHPLALNLTEGLIRMSILVLYIWSIARMKDVQRVLEYHGAEHKAIYAYEAGAELTVEAAIIKPRKHPRCGTSFLLFVVLVSVIVFSFFGWPNLLLRIALRLVLLPVVAGISYEAIRLAGRSQHPLVKLMVLPGLWLQNFTTREPDDSQLEVATAALQAVLTEERGLGDH